MIQVLKKLASLEILLNELKNLRVLYQLKNKKGECQNKDRLKEDVRNFYDTLSNLKENLRLDLDIQNFENHCHLTNC